MGRGAIALTLLFTLGAGRRPVRAAAAVPRQARHDARRRIGPARRSSQHLLEGLIRVVIFVGYLLLVSRSAEIRRVFQYHGAEHMTIHALEHEDPLDLEHVRQYPTAHPRCGTEFLVVFIIVSILMFSLLAGQNLLVSIVGRILLIPVIASVAYEILRFGARHRHRAGGSAGCSCPASGCRRITTKQPDDSMIEVAIASMQEALAANGEEAPEGSLDPPREPIPDVKALADETARAIGTPVEPAATADTADR